MKSINRFNGVTVGLCVLLGALLAVPAYSGTDDLKAGKREKFEDDSVVTMQERLERKEETEEAYRKTMLENSEKTIKLLEKILVALHDLKTQKDE